MRPSSKTRRLATARRMTAAMMVAMTAATTVVVVVAARGGGGGGGGGGGSVVVDHRQLLARKPMTTATATATATAIRRGSGHRHHRHGNGGDSRESEEGHTRQQRRRSSSSSSSSAVVIIDGECQSTSSSSSSSSNTAVLRRGGEQVATTSSRSHYPPRALATLAMATCMSLHYLAYSLARPATMTLFTSSRFGFGGGDGGGGSTSTAYPLAMTFISPVSFLLLLWYGSVLERNGPRGALTKTTLGCAAALGGSGILVGKLDSLLSPSSSSSSTATSLLARRLTKYVVGALFVLRESYVQLLTSQHWSFVSSVLTPAESSTWYGPVSGLTSVTSALGAVGVGTLSGKVGLAGVLVISGITLACSVYFGGLAYGIAEENGFNPTDEHNSNRRSNDEKKRANDNISNSEKSLFAKARDVFARVPTLWALFCEILACQCLSTLLNVCFVTRVSESIPDDTERAGYVGRFYAGINVLSSALQFGVLPLTSKYAEPCALWRGMPLVVLGVTSLLSFPRLGGGAGAGTAQHPSLDMVATAFLLMKTMEFSVRRMLDEMVYVPLDYESRFLGKEVIGVLGYRFGKSGASLALSAITSSFFGGGGGAMGVRGLSHFATAAAGLWLVAAWRLSNLVPTKEEAEEAYRKMKKTK